jgi:chorismate mutase-like protein
MISPSPQLDSLRVKIDALDLEILELLAKRVELVLKVGDYKRQNSLPVYDPERERSLLKRLSEAARAPLDAETVVNVFMRLIDECRRIEQHHVQAR